MGSRKQYYLFLTDHRRWTNLFSIIVGFPRQEDVAKIRNAMSQYGFHAPGPCTLGSQVIALANTLDEGIVISGFQFSDMHYSELSDYLPKGFEMLLVASPEKLEYCQENNIVCLPMPIKTQDLLDTLNMMTYQRAQRKKKEKAKPKLRSEEDTSILSKAKQVLMDRNNMNEEEAHRYLQKNSMDTGTDLIEMAEMVLKMF